MSHSEGLQRLASGDDSDSDYESENFRPRGLWNQIDFICAKCLCNITLMYVESLALQLNSPSVM